MQVGRVRKFSFIQCPRNHNPRMMLLPMRMMMTLMLLTHMLVSSLVFVLQLRVKMQLHDNNYKTIIFIII